MEINFMEKRKRDLFLLKLIVIKLYADKTYVLVFYKRDIS